MRWALRSFLFLGLNWSLIHKWVYSVCDSWLGSHCGCMEDWLSPIWWLKKTLGTSQHIVILSCSRYDKNPWKPFHRFIHKFSAKTWDKTLEFLLNNLQWLEILCLAAKKCQIMEAESVFLQNFTLFRLLRSVVLSLEFSSCDIFREITRLPWFDLAWHSAQRRTLID